MKRTFRRRGAVLAAALVLLCAVSFADRGGPASFAATGWALLPPTVAIVLAFATKEVYSSLLAGCVVGALLTEGFAPWRSFETLFLTLMEGIDLKIFFFDVLLGAIVVLFARSGGSRAFGEWASRRVRSRRGAVTATAGLGCLIFLDDYFNCLTVGAIMQPITDRCRVSREKLSFIIDATAAPVCILAPISSWAAAVSSYIPADYSHVNGFALFIQAIPYNFYALLMLWLVFLVALTGRDFGPMYRREQLALRQEPPRPETAPEGRDRPRGRAVDLLLPTACLIVTVVWGMAVLGRRSCREAGLALTASNVFANTDAPMALCFDQVLGLKLTEKAASLRKTQAAAPAAGGFTVVCEDGGQDPQVEALIRARADAKKAKNFAEADRIRDELKSQGIEITDIPGGAKWKHI